MSVVGDILKTWVRPGAVIRQKLDLGVGEPAALVTVMGAGLILFVSQWPSLARAAYLNPDIPLDARLGGALLGSIFMLPLLAYALALVSHLVARGLGGQGTGFAARLSLFWALLSIAPATLFQGLAAGLMGPGPAQTSIQVLVFACFVYLWLAMLLEVERPRV